MGELRYSGSIWDEGCIYTFPRHGFAGEGFPKNDDHLADSAINETDTSSCDFLDEWKVGRYHYGSHEKALSSVRFLTNLITGFHLHFARASLQAWETAAEEIEPRKGTPWDTEERHRQSEPKAISSSVGPSSPCKLQAAWWVWAYWCSNICSRLVVFHSASCCSIMVNGW